MHTIPSPLFLLILSSDVLAAVRIYKYYTYWNSNRSSTQEYKASVRISLSTAIVEISFWGGEAKKSWKWNAVSRWMRNDGINIFFVVEEMDAFIHWQRYFGSKNSDVGVEWMCFSMLTMLDQIVCLTEFFTFTYRATEMSTDVSDLHNILGTAFLF